MVFSEPLPTVGKMILEKSYFDAYQSEMQKRVRPPLLKDGHPTNDYETGYPVITITALKNSFRFSTVKASVTIPRKQIQRIKGLADIFGGFNFTQMFSVCSYCGNNTKTYLGLYNIQAEFAEKKFACIWCGAKDSDACD